MGICGRKEAQTVLSGKVGASFIRKYPDTKVFICAYHYEKDREELTGFLEKQGFQVTTSNSRLFYRFPGNTRYSFRAGVLRAQK